MPEGFSTDSYPKAPSMPVSPLDIARKFGDIQQQSLQINQAKLDQANQALGYMTRAMGSLGPNASKEDYAKVAQNAVDQGLVPQNTLNIYEERLQAAPTSQDFYNEFMTAAAGHQQQIDYHLGKVGTSETGQTVTPTVVSPKPGFGQRPIGMPVQVQTPPQAVVNNPDTNTPTTVGAQAPQLAPGTVAQPTPLSVARPTVATNQPMSLSSLATSPAAPTAPATVAQRIDAANPTPKGYSAGTPPLFDEGKKAYTEDQGVALARATAMKPAEQALKLLPGLRSGPGTEPFNKAVAFLKANNIIDTDTKDDPTAIYQEVNKKLSQYVAGSPTGQRSDAAQTLAEAGSPSPKTQINPALIKLTRDALALDRVQIARPNAFEGNDYQNYGKHRATFPQSIDERAFGLDDLPNGDRQSLVKKMITKYQKNPNDLEAKKFLRSYDIAKKQGFVGNNTDE